MNKVMAVLSDQYAGAELLILSFTTQAVSIEMQGSICLSVARICNLLLNWIFAYIPFVFFDVYI